jgi:hypothetical protein
VVSVPQEAGSPREAMQLADLRMYAQKESRRVSRDAGLPLLEQPDREAGRVEA